MLTAIKATLLVMLASLSCGAQNDVWYFGDGAALSFLGGSPTAIPGSTLPGIDNMTSVSGQTGNVLFYSNGMDVYDASHNLMMNGDGLGGSNTGGQCALIVPRPASTEYYLFTVGQWASSAGLRYSIVDMSLNGGLGAVTVKGQLLLPTSTERLETVRNPNDGSWWLLTHAWATDEFLAYHISTAGLDVTPVVSAAGSVHDGGIPYGYNAAGQLTASPDGTQLVCGIYTDAVFEFFDLDPTTGVVTNARSIPGFPKAWGAAFSPGGSKLYLTKWYDDEVIQLDLDAGTWSDVLVSETLVGITSIIGSFGGYQAGYLQLGPDGRVYVAKFGQDMISTIEYPEAAGTSCGFVDNSISLGSGICKAGLCRSVTTVPAKPTGIFQEGLADALHVFYDPIDHDVIITGSVPEGNIDLALIDATGRIVLRSNRTTTTSGLLRIHSPGLVSGAYAVLIAHLNASKVARFVVAR